MTEYVITFLVLLGGTFAFYLLYDRYFRRNEKPVTSLYVEALRDLLDGQQVAAFSKLRQVVAEDSGNLDAYLRLGKILRDGKKPDRALQVHKDLTLRGGLSANDKVAILQQLALDYRDLEDMDMAQAALREIIELQPRNHWAHVMLLEVQEDRGKWQEAFDTAAALLKMEAGKSKKPLAVFKFRQGEDLYRKKEFHKARIIFKEAIGLDPSFVSPYLAIGDSYCQEQRFEDAVNFWNKLIAAIPDQGHLVIDRLKRTLFDLGRFGEIAEICEHILRHSPKNLEARLTLAEFHEKKGNLDTAVEILTQVVDDSPSHLPAILELIRVHLERQETGRIEQLSRDLKRHQEKLRQPAKDTWATTELIKTT